jgi:hypothetical protein
VPSASPFTITYTAAPDKIQDSHLNALQNVVMAIQQTLGIKSTVNGEGTGIVSLPLLADYDPHSLAEYQAVQTILPSIRFISHLRNNIEIGSTDTIGIPGYGTGIAIYLGQTGAGGGKDTVWIDANSFTVATTNGLAGNPGGVYRIGLTTGDSLSMSGCVLIASQTTIGAPGGACMTYQGTVPSIAGAFYSGAALRVHGGIWFGSGLSGNGNVTFVTTTGQAVDIQGNLIATTLDVNGLANFDGVAAFNNIVNIVHPGYLIVNNDVVMNNKPNNTPAKIDGMDPSYISYAVSNSVKGGEIVQSVRTSPNVSHATPYASNAVRHPLYGFQMYPMLGGWAFTGTVKYECAKLSGDRNILLLETNMPAIGNNSNGVVTVPVNIGGGTSTVTTGYYSTGLFNPGDTFIEIKGVNDADSYSYPIYYHQPFYNGTIVTGLNVYVAADDSAFQSSIAGKQYRIFQPGNVPMAHLSGNWAGASANPTVVFGNQNYADYPGTTIAVVTDRSWLGGNNVTDNGVQFKHTAPFGGVVEGIKEALSKSVNGLTGTSLNMTGVAYVYVVGSNTANTIETQINLRASPTPYGIASPQVQLGSPRLVPGQHIPVGEVYATSTNGTTWTHLQTVSYRENGYYDSCWVPLVDYVKTSIPTDQGRVLPFWSSTNQSDASDDTGYYMFYVEHNLGPVAIKSDIEARIFVASYGTQSFDVTQGLSGNGQSARFKLSSNGSQNLWTPYNADYAAGHSFAQSPTVGTRGFLREVSARFQLAYIDSRFAKFIWDGQSQDLSNVFRGSGSRLAGYIRVIMRKVR